MAARRYPAESRAALPVGGIGTATFGAIILCQLLREPAERHDDLATADSGVDLETVPPVAVH